MTQLQDSSNITTKVGFWHVFIFCIHQDWGRRLSNAIILTNTNLYTNTITNTAICPQRFGLWHLLRFSLKIEATACPVPWLSCWDGTSIQDIYRTMYRMVYNKNEIQAHKNTNTSTLRCRTMDTITAAKYKGTPAWRKKT